MAVKPIPDGYTSVAPYLFVEDSRAAIPSIDVAATRAAMRRLGDEVGAAVAN